VTHLLHERDGRKRRVESDNAGAKIQRRGQGARPVGIVALAGWRDLSTLQKPQGKGHLQTANQIRQQNPQRRSQMRCLPQAIHRHSRHNL